MRNLDLTEFETGAKAYWRSKKHGTIPCEIIGQPSKGRIRISAYLPTERFRNELTVSIKNLLTD